MFLPPSPLPKAVPAAGRFRLPMTPFPLRVLPCPLRAARAPQKPWLQRRPSHSRHIYPGARRRSVEHRQQRAMHPRCRLWVRARRGPSAFFLTRYNPTPSPTAAAGSAHDPCSCRLAGPHGATTVRPRPRRAYMGTPVLRLTPSPGETPTAHTRPDALGDAAELRFADSVARYSHVDLKREQHAEPMLHDMVCYVPIGRPSVLPPDILACCLSHKGPCLSDIKELAGKVPLHTTDDDTVLFVRNSIFPPTRSDKPNSVGRVACLPNDEPVRIYVPLLMRPWIMQASHSTSCCHLSTTRTMRMLERLYRWIGMIVCTRWWLRHCLNCQARKTPRLTVRWPIFTMPLPEGPGVAVSVDYFGPLPVTPRGNTHILLFTDHFSRRADMFPVAAAEFTAEGTANILVNQYIPLWGCPRTILSDNGLQFCSKLFTGCISAVGCAQASYKLLSSQLQRGR